MISGNSLVGTHLMSATIRQLGLRCQLVYGNTDWPRAEARLTAAVGVAFASRTVRQAKLGLVGHQAPGFVDFHPDPALLCCTFGTLLQHVGLVEYIDIANNVITEEEVRDYFLLQYPTYYFPFHQLFLFTYVQFPITYFLFCIPFS